MRETVRKGIEARRDIKISLRFALPVLMLTLGFTHPASARDASFLDPGNASLAAADDAVRVEPKGDIDIGDSVLNVARHVDLFFVNQGANPVHVEKVAVNGDGNVTNEVVSDDCSKQGSIPPGSRCSVEVSVTPSSPGAWTAEVLLTHDGAGRIARAKLTGKTSGTASVEKKDLGLALNAKEATPVSFGDVDVDSGKVVRSALMVNDSPAPITLYSIDVIEASNGLQRLDQGCAVDMELKPGESCPVTLVWTPTSSGQISTDLIIRHSGKLGFAVIPIRGAAKGGPEKSTNDKDKDKPSGKEADAGPKSSIPSPPGARDLERAMSGHLAPVSEEQLTTASKSAAGGSFYLIGTVGNRAVLLTPEGKTLIANSGDDIEMGKNGAKITLVTSRSVDLMMDGKKKTIYLMASQDLIDKASSAQKSKNKDKPRDTDSGDNETASSKSGASTSGSASGASGAGASGSTATPSIAGAAK